MAEVTSAVGYQQSNFVFDANYLKNEFNES